MTMEIPSYPDAREIEIDDKPRFDGLFAASQPRMSELTFASLYLFRTAHSYRLTLVGDALVVLARGYDGTPYFLPPLSGDQEGAAIRLLEDGLTLYGVDDAFAAGLSRAGGYSVAEDRDNFDYLYLKNDLAELAGNRYHKKKNRINYVTRHRDCLIEPYGEEVRAGCVQLLEEWRRVHADVESRSLAPEAEAAREGLNLWRQLGLEGVVVQVEGQVKAFAFGERLNRETAVCHFEKADPFMDGLYQLVDREFNRLLLTDCTYVNREQDLGERNLRETKLSYHPVELVRKVRVRKI